MLLTTLTTLVTCLVAATVLAGCGGAKVGARSPVYTASFGKIKVALTVPAETNSTSSVIEKVNRYLESLLSTITVPHALASYKVDNGSSRPTLCDDYSFGLTYGDGPVTYSFNAKESLESELKTLSKSNVQDKALLSQGMAALNRLQNTNEVKQGHSGTAYYLFDTPPGMSGAMRVTVTSSESHETKSMMKQLESRGTH
jgi:hypothetical protein